MQKNNLLISCGQFKKHWLIHYIEFVLHLKLYLKEDPHPFFHASVIAVFHIWDNSSIFNKYVLVRYFLISFPRQYFENVLPTKSWPYFALLGLSGLCSCHTMKDPPFSHSGNGDISIPRWTCESFFLISVKCRMFQQNGTVRTPFPTPLPNTKQFEGGEGMINTGEW